MKECINKSHLIKNIAQKNSGTFSEKDIKLAVDSIIEQMSKTLSDDGRIEIRGFGSFTSHKLSCHVGRNPKTGESVYLDDRYIPYFKSGKALREQVNKGKESKD